MSVFVWERVGRWGKDYRKAFGGGGDNFYIFSIIQIFISAKMYLENSNMLFG